MTRLLLLGWDAADWKVIDPLLARGEMPHLARLLAGGVRGNLATIHPPLSPMVWTTIATGKRPTRHGIHGFTEPTEDGLGVRPISVLGRNCKALWNILGQSGRRSVVVGWWPTHPAEPISGVMVSDRFPLGHGDPRDMPLRPGTVWPEALADRLAELRVHGSEITGDIVRLFVPRAASVDQAADKSLHDLAGIIAETMSTHAAATELIVTEKWDLAAVYFTGIDHFSHRFMRYHAGKVRAGVGDTDPALYAGVVEAGYRYHDAMLGRLLHLAGPDCAVMIVSDHGFHSDRLLPDHIPAEAAGPAVEHRDFGIFCLTGPGVRQGEQVYGASVLDIAPTVLHLMGLPAARDMDGKVLVNAFTEARPLPLIASWEAVAGADGQHPPERRHDGDASYESLQQLVALGYVEPPGDGVGDAVAACVAENRYNLARAHIDAGEYAVAAGLLRDLIAGDAEQMRYHQHLFHCLLRQGDREGCAAMLEALDSTAAAIAERAAAELQRRRDIRPDREVSGSRAAADQREMFERRQLAAKCDGFAGERLLLRCRLALGDTADVANKAAARALLDQLAAHPPTRRRLLLFLAEGYALIGDNERALDFTRRARRVDREDWRALALEARIHHAAGRDRQAADRAAQSLALVYFQPFLHHLLGTTLSRLGDNEAALRAFQVALAQAPGLAAAHDAIAEILRRRGDAIGEASLHMAAAEMLRRRASEPRPEPVAVPASAPAARALPPAFERGAATPPPDRARLITIVAGLPRTGTSMMMQMLAAGGVAPFTDGNRPPDADNPRGYFEHDGATRLHRDASWLGEAAGKAVKIVTQFVPFLPDDGEYRIVFMRRDLDEVVASQHAMLRRNDRRGARLDADTLARTYAGQLIRLRRWLETQSKIPVLTVDYAVALADPAATAARLHRFLGDPFDTASAAAAVDAALRRQHHATELLEPV